MKYIKYDEHGKAISSEETKLTEKDLQQISTPNVQLNVVETLTKKRTIRGVIIGIIIAVPVAALAQIIYLFASGRLVGENVSVDYTFGIVVFAIIVLISTAWGYVSGSMADRE